MTEYLEHLQKARRFYPGTLLEALERERLRAMAGFPRLRDVSTWWAYRGSETGPFVICTRWQRGKITVELIVGETEGEGRMQPVCDALEAFAANCGLAVRFEAVLHAGLARFLRRRGYAVAPHTPDAYPDLVLPAPG